MKTPTAFLVTSFLSLTCLAGSASAYDDDYGYGPNRPVYMEGRGYMPWQGGRGSSEGSATDNRNVPLFYRPTQRYYGPGYTVNYRYIPVFRGEGVRETSVNGATNFRSDIYRLTPEQVAAWGANSPKVVVKDARSSVPRTAVTSITRKKVPSKAPAQPAPAAAPAITPATAEVPVPSAPNP